MKQKTVVCTVVLGNRYERLFREYAHESWRTYCSRHGYELVIFRRLLADLPGKSVAWQKLFILDQPELCGFERIIWVDADVVISPKAPSIEVPAGRIGYVQEKPYKKTIAEWYGMFRLPPSSQVVQTGVLSLEPGHSAILRSVADYPETTMYEMPALSRQISESGVGYELDPRFNALLSSLMLDYAPYWILACKPLKEFLWTVGYRPLRRAVRQVCSSNWFIHAAGAKRDIMRASKAFSRAASN